jgi:hypothetical protein
MRPNEWLSDRLWPEAAAQVVKWRTTATDPKRTFATAYLDLQLHVRLAATYRFSQKLEVSEGCKF